MSSDVSRLALVPVSFDGITRLDYIIDGASLHQLLGCGDYLPVLAPDDPINAFLGQVNRLLRKGPPSFPDGRQTLFSCRACGLPDCGAVTAEIGRDGRCIVWSDFGMQRDDAPDVYLRDEHVGPFRFPVYEYYAVFNDLRLARRYG